MRPVVVLGDVLLDEDVDGRVERLCPDAPAPVLDVDGGLARPGGAGLAAALLAADGVPVRLIAALGHDGPARTLRTMFHGCVDLVTGPAGGGTAVKTRLRASGRVLLRADRGEGRATDGFGAAVGPVLGEALDEAEAVLVSDYGRGVAADPIVRAAVARAARRGVPVVWDPHPRGVPPVPGVAVVTPNLSEACGVLGVPAPDAADDDAVLDLADALLGHWCVGAVVITLGARGAAVRQARDGGVAVPAHPTVDGDPCGAGDRFAGCVAGRLACGVPLHRAVEDGVLAATGFVAGGGAGAVRRAPDGWRQPARGDAARRAGGLAPRPS
ncbi:MAG: PfkB family carbohydrate kinase [Pseudonocardia sp.]